jgi:starvation-inducible outer membrane lipoprotein
MMTVFALSLIVVFGVLEKRRRVTMRMIGLFAMCVLLEACTTAPIFSPEIMKNVETNTFDVEAWRKQTYQSPNADFVPHKVELGGEIVEVIQKPEGVLLLVEKQPIKNYTADSSKGVKRGDSFWYAITFNGAPDPGMLRRGNKLAVVGMTARPGTEMIGGAPRVLPHLTAQCLHIWNTRESEMADFSYYGGAMGHHPQEEETFCLGDDNEKSFPVALTQVMRMFAL